mgnify:CR=1 FL=1
MPSVSKKQQRFMGIVRAYQKGTLETEATPEVQRAAASMKKKDVKKFASTKHKGLPEKKVTKESFNEDAKMAKQSDDKLKAAHTKFSGMDKSPANTFMLKRIQREMNKRKRSVMKEDYVKELEDGLVKMEYPAYDEVDKLMQKIAKENDIDTTTLHMAFKTKHLMVPDDWAKRKMMEPVMIPKTGAAKPTYVSTDKPKKKVNEDVEGRKTALTEPKSTKERLARKKDSEIRREAERSMYDSSAGESEIAKRTRIARKLRSSTDPKNQDKGKQMEIDTTKKLVGEEFGKMTKEQEDIYVGNKAGRIKFDKITDYKKRKQLKKNLKTYEGDEDHTTTTSESYSSKSSNAAKKAKLSASIERLENLKVKKKMNEAKKVKVKLKDPSKIKVKVTDIGAGGKEYVRKDEMQSEAAAWTRKAGKNSSGGLNEKGRKSYERENPGSDLKAPSKKKGNKRRASFCARMKGMKSKLTSAKTARDPDSRINKSLRAWNCSYEPENGEVISESKVAEMIKSLKRKTRVLEKGEKKNRDAGAIAAKIMKQKEHNKYVNFLPMDEAKKKCGEGEYYCNDDKKCKSIPKGYRVGYGGMLKPDNSDDDTKGKNGNGNGHGGNGNGGNGGGNGGGDGGGGE